MVLKIPANCTRQTGNFSVPVKAVLTLAAQVLCARPAFVMPSGVTAAVLSNLRRDIPCHLASKLSKLR